MKKSLAIEVHNLSKVYKLYKEPLDRFKEAIHPFGKKYHEDFYALHDVSFEIKKGETVGIIGRNGSGKSTLLKIITGVVRASSGRVGTHGRISAILELGAGFNPEMNGIENIYLNNSINGISKKETDRKLQEILDFAELGEFIYQPLKSYSSGMQARLGFAVAINADPDILIVDEALAVGDAAFQRKCFAKMEAIRKTGATILFVSHSEGQIVDLCSRAIWLSNSEKVLEGDPKSVTGLYTKHANEQTVDKKLLQKEFDELQKKKEQKVLERRKKIELLKTDEFYNPALISKSTISFKEEGAKIYDFWIENQNGKKVNVLKNGEIYHYCYKVKYERDFAHVRLGMYIKTQTGIVLGGGQYPYNKTKEGISVEAGREYLMRWSFRCNLDEGVYFLNAGTFDIAAQKQLHRVLDAYMFKVSPITEKMLSAGPVTFIEEGMLDVI